MTLTSAEKTIVARWAASLPADVTLDLDLHLAAGEAGDLLRRFGEALALETPRLTLRSVPAADGELPGFHIGSNVRFHAVPHHVELEVFLEAVATAAALPPRPAAPRPRAVLELFIAPRCPFCPEALRRMLPPTSADPDLALSVVDALLFGERAAARSVQATPTLLLDGRYRWSGTLPVADILLLAAGSDPTQMGTGAFESLLGNGQAAQVAELMIAAGRIAPAFIALLADERLSARLGAMVVVETLADEAPTLAGTLVAPLWEAFDAAPDPVKGDLLYVLGLVADEHQASRIATVAAGTADADVREAAAEALEAIAARAAAAP